MATADTLVLVGGILACVAAVLFLLGLAVLITQIRRLEQDLDVLRTETVPLVTEARNVVDHASSEMDRVGAVLEGSESVTARVDSASRLAQRAFANPIVKVLAFRAGTASGIRTLREPVVSDRKRSKE